MEPAEQRPATCILCRQQAFAPRWFSDYRTNGPREEWGQFYVRSTELPQPPDNGFLYWYCFCGPTCRANAAVQRYENARLEIAQALLEVQQAIVEALAEVGAAWNALDQ